MIKETKKGESWRRGYLAGVAEFKDICLKCRGKGYGTSLEFAEGGGKRWRLPVIKYCECSRGQQLKELYTEKDSTTKTKRGKI